jgi:uncharacterized protein
MNPLTAFVKRYPQAVFWAIAWGTSFAGWALHSRYPSDWWQLVTFGVFFAGWIVTSLADGRLGVKEYFSRIVRWRVSIKWYLAALLIPLALRLVAFGLNVLFGAKIVSGAQLPAIPELIIEFLIVFFLIALGEEPGFRGFALPRLMIGRNALAASLILGLLHTIWHAPLLISGADSMAVIPIIFGGAVLNTWLFNNTGGSVFLAMFLHASVNLWVGFFQPLFSTADAERQTWWLAAAYVGLAILLPILTGKELGRDTQVSTNAMPARRAVGTN